MENKMLTIQNFYRNQHLLDALNGLLVYLKLQGKGVDARISETEAQEWKNTVLKFLHQLNQLVGNIEKNAAEPLTGVDERLRNLTKNFVAAKRKQTRFKSFLFKHDISELEFMLKNLTNADRQKVIESLGELSTLLEEQTSLDVKEIVGEI